MPAFEFWKKIPLQAYRGPLLLWSALILTALFWVTSSQYHDNRGAFFQLVQQTQVAAQHRIQANEVILETLSELVGPSDLFLQERIQSVADSLIQHHPQIRAVLLLPTLPHDEEEELIKQYQKYQTTDFSLPDDPTDFELTSPILFYYARADESGNLLGKDAQSIPPLLKTMQATKDNHPLSSHPYLFNGKNHYFLVSQARRPLSFEDEIFPWYTEIHIALLIDPNYILPKNNMSRASLSLYDPGNRISELLCDTSPNQNSDTDSWLSRALHYKIKLESISQPFLMTISTTIPLLQLSAAPLLLLILGSLLFFHLTHRRITQEQETRLKQRHSEKRLLLTTKNRVQMLNAISHDIRTPLTRLQLRTATMLKGDAKQKSISDLKEIEDLVESSLNYLRGEEQNEEPQITDFNEMAYTIQSDLAEQQHLFAIHGKARWPYLCQPLQMKRAIQNLINNAFRFADHVELQLLDHDRNLTIEILDNGPGIDTELLDKVTHPYYRADDSRNNQTGGIGLGLAIVREITEAHDGVFTLKNRPEGGLHATISLPR
ncbi:MAG: hypothetical protein HN382_00870 [Gammaproteobacteria bacterium]|jgi:signal transduction histidine kinase|nr:hypothetical protein [Gammaproteobacteria bacterium]MBT4608052.1 hypothetical protein [Thiotrichales bacterium]MBT3471624.1 hypothetical protein [Gammaproteobacteria bacterium]MBT3966083.1 hypothetical protein [Gammaproteobacteria bacterium]MBT4330344.1 hypothetical protein [Gammaproteobacteria bacterium]